MLSSVSFETFVKLMAHTQSSRVDSVVVADPIYKHIDADEGAYSQAKPAKVFKKEKRPGDDPL